MVPMANAEKKNETKDKKTNEEMYYPTNDYLFKRIFGYKGNEAITQDLIEAILEKDCEVVEITSDEVTEKDLQEDKIGVLDVFVTEKGGTQINLEMQVAEYEYIIDRILFYWAKKYVECIHSGDRYEKLKPTKVILITNFEVKKLSSLKETVNSFKIIDTKTGKLVLTENLELVIIELPKMKKYESNNKRLEMWLKFIIDPNRLGAKDMSENDKLQKAKDEYDKVMADEHEKMLIRLREKYWLDYNSMKSASFNSGVEEGKRQRQRRTVERNGKKERQKGAAEKKSLRSF